MVKASTIQKLTKAIIAGKTLDQAQLLKIAVAPLEELPVWMAGALRIERSFFCEKVHLCGIVSARSGACDQDCIFCAQSARYQTGAPIYNFIDVEQIAAAAKRAKQAKARSFSIVTSGEKLSSTDLNAAIAGIKAIAAVGLQPCASLGVIDSTALKRLREAGLIRYHHNLETARSFYSHVCTTRSFDDNIRVLRDARSAGLRVCSGALFGLGEAPQQRVELLMELREIDVDSVPLNFLIPITGTPLAKVSPLTDDDCLRIIALARFCLPNKEIMVCGGRNECLGQRQSELFAAGASGMMIGDLLTVKGRTTETDLAMLASLALEPCDP